MKAKQIIAFSSSIASFFYGFFWRSEEKIPPFPSFLRVGSCCLQTYISCAAPGLAPKAD